VYFTLSKTSWIVTKWFRPARYHARVLDGSDDAKVVTFYDDDEKKSS
jgi:hypothetical protein